jgi:hypothetical protein
MVVLADGLKANGDTEMNSEQIMNMVNEILDNAPKSHTESDQIKPTIIFAVNVAIFYKSLIDSGVDMELAGKLTLTYLAGIIEKMNF